jgi:hypothetical protein
MKFGDAKITPFISVEGPDGLSMDRPAAPRKNYSVVSTARHLDDYEQEIISMRREETSLTTAIRSLFVEMCRFIAWRRDMCEGTGAPSWCEWQRVYSANLRTQHSISAANLREIAERKLPGQSQLLFDGIVREPNRFGEAITAQAKKELGL